MQGVLNIKKAPPDEGFEFVLAGRSNAGKSSALNCLTKNKKLARTSKMPGRTTEVNFFKVNDEIKLVDLPGYGFSKMSIDKKKNLDILLDNYFSSRQSLCAAIIFMDIRHPLKDSDIQMMEFCNRHGVPFISVLTKSDKLNSSAIAKSTKSVEKKLSKAAIETLSIIVYHQPVTRAEIEEIRGVAFGTNTLDILMELNWVKPMGRKEVPGKPIQYGTTEDFLSHFNLQKLSDLPTVDELSSAGLIDSSSVDASIFGTGKFYQEKQDEKKENIYSDIDEMLNSTLKDDDTK